MGTHFYTMLPPVRPHLGTEGRGERAETRKKIQEIIYLLALLLSLFTMAMPASVQGVNLDSPLKRRGLDYQPSSTRVIRRGEGAGLAFGTYPALSLNPLPMSDSGEAGGAAFCLGQG